MIGSFILVDMACIHITKAICKDLGGKLFVGEAKTETKNAGLNSMLERTPSCGTEVPLQADY